MKKVSRSVFIGLVIALIFIRMFGYEIYNVERITFLIAVLALALWVGPPLSGDPDYIEPSRRRDGYPVDSLN